VFVLRYRGAVAWYRKGIDLTLHFFERIYGKRKFGSVSFVRSMQIATLYFWSAAILVIIMSGIYVNGFTALLQPVVLIYGFLFSVLAALSVKMYFLTGRMIDFLQMVISKLLNNLEHPFFSQIKNLQLNKFAIMQPHQSLVRIILALTAILFFHFSMVKLNLLGFSDFDPDLVGDNSLVGYLLTSMLMLLLLTYMSLLFRFIVEVGIFYPIFGAVFAGFFFSNDHSNFMIFVFIFLVYPTTNAVFDFISIGATRSFLTRIVEQNLKLASVVRNLCLDLLVAMTSFIGFTISLFIMVNLIAVVVLGLLFEADPKTVRSMDFVNISDYFGIARIQPTIDDEGVTTQPLQGAVDWDEMTTENWSEAFEDKEARTGILILIAIFCVLGGTTYAPSLIHFLIVCTNSYSQKTKSWRKAVVMLKEAPSPVSKVWANAVLINIRRGHLWGWSVVLWLACLSVLMVI
jgi:hypothetical protein